MKKLFLITAIIAGLTFAHGVPDMHIKKEDSEDTMHHYTGMGMHMMAMKDPELRKLIRDHMKQCKRELHKKLMKHPKMIRRMLKMLAMNKEEVQRVLEENPELKEEFKTLLGGE